jgi:nucleoid-associated protein YgaU
MSVPKGLYSLRDPSDRTVVGCLAGLLAQARPYLVRQERFAGRLPEPRKGTQVAPRALRTEKRVVQRTTRRTPRQATATWSGHSGADYTVRLGDTLSEIAARFEVTGGWRTLHERNRHVVGANPDLILPGQRLDVR